MNKRIWFVVGMIVGFLILLLGRNQMFEHNFLNKAIEFLGLLTVLINLNLFMKTKSDN